MTEENQRELEKLKQTLSDTTKSIVFLFGAGISASLSQKSYSWEQWVRDGTALLPGENLKKYIIKSLRTRKTGMVLLLPIHWYPPWKV